MGVSTVLASNTKGKTSNLRVRRVAGPVWIGRQVAPRAASGAVYPSHNAVVVKDHDCNLALIASDHDGLASSPSPRLRVVVMTLRLSRIGLMESRLHRHCHCHGGPPPLLAG